MPTAEDADRWIQSRYGGRAGPLVPLGAGAWSQAYSFVLDDRELVAKCARHHEDLEKDRRMGALASPALPIPRVLDVGPAPGGGYISVAERVRGRYLDELAEPAMRAVLPDLLRVLDALAALDLSGRPGYGPWGPDGSAPYRSWRAALLAFADDRLAGWRDAVAASPTASAALRRGGARLRDVAAGLPDVRQIIHGDLLYRNVLVEGPRVAGIIDWGNSQYGDALYDAAWLLFWWPWHPWSGIDIRGELDGHWARRGAVPPDLEARLRCYQLRIGLEHIVWYAWRGQRAHLERAIRQTLELADG
jgi:hygromycin-B 4-O-kinase